MHANYASYCTAGHEQYYTISCLLGILYMWIISHIISCLLGILYLWIISHIISCLLGILYMLNEYFTIYRYIMMNAERY